MSDYLIIINCLLIWIIISANFINAIFYLNIIILNIIRNYSIKIYDNDYI